MHTHIYQYAYMWIIATALNEYKYWNTEYMHGISAPALLLDILLRQVKFFSFSICVYVLYIYICVWKSICVFYVCSESSNKKKLKKSRKIHIQLKFRWFFLFSVHCDCRLKFSFSFNFCYKSKWSDCLIFWSSIDYLQHRVFVHWTIFFYRTQRRRKKNTILSTDLEKKRGYNINCKNCSNKKI